MDETLEVRSWSKISVKLSIPRLIINALCISCHCIDKIAILEVLMAERHRLGKVILNINRDMVSAKNRHITRLLLATMRGVNMTLYLYQSFFVAWRGEKVNSRKFSRPVSCKISPEIIKNIQNKYPEISKLVHLTSFISKLKLVQDRRLTQGSAGRRRCRSPTANGFEGSLEGCDTGGGAAKCDLAARCKSLSKGV